MREHVLPPSADLDAMFPGRRRVARTRGRVVWAAEAYGRFYLVLETPATAEEVQASDHPQDLMTRVLEFDDPDTRDAHLRDQGWEDDAPAPDDAVAGDVDDVWSAPNQPDDALLPEADGASPPAERTPAPLGSPDGSRAPPSSPEGSPEDVGTEGRIPPAPPPSRGIVRIWRAKLRPGTAEAFEDVVQDALLPALRTADGCRGWTVGFPRGDEADVCVVVTRWRDLDALRAFVGDGGDHLGILEAEAPHVEEVTVEHLRTMEDGTP